MVLLEKQQELLQLSKEKALGDVDAFFDKIIHVNIFVGMNYLPFNDGLFTMTILRLLPHEPHERKCSVLVDLVTLRNYFSLSNSNGIQLEFIR